jgi:hypothetical protein
MVKIRERKKETSIDEWADSADQSVMENAYPWQGDKIREDVLKVYNLRLPEAYLLKLKYIADHTPGSMQKFCLDALLPAIDKEINKLLKK